MFARTYHPSTTLLVFAALLVVLLVMTGPAQAAPHFYAADNDQHVIVGVGDQVEVVLRSEPNSDLTWMPMPDDSSLLRHMGHTFQRTALDGQGMHTLRFIAVHPGSTILRLQYARPRGGDAAPRQVFTLRIDAVRSWNDAGAQDLLRATTTPGFRDAGASALRASLAGWRDAGAGSSRSQPATTPGFRDAGASAPRASLAGWRDAGAGSLRSQPATTPGFRDAGASA
jgi:predicted secreted protein